MQTAMSRFELGSLSPFLMIITVTPYIRCILWKSDLPSKIKRDFFRALAVSILLYRCTTTMLTKHRDKKLDQNYTRMLHAFLNKSWKQYPTKQQLYGQLPPILQTISSKTKRHQGHCWRSKDELISDFLIWTLAHGCAIVGRPAKTDLHQLYVDTGCNLEALPRIIR